MALVPARNFCEEAQELGSTQRLNSLAERVIKTVDQLALSQAGANIGVLLDIPSLNLELQNLSNEAAKCRSLKVMHLLSFDSLQALLKTLEGVVRSVSGIVLPSSAATTKEANIMVIIMALNASLTALHIMTSLNTQPSYTDETVEVVAAFIRYCLENLVYHSYSSTSSIKYQKDKNNDLESKNQGKGMERNMPVIHKKIYDCIGLLSDLVCAQQLTDTVILHISSIGLSAFFKGTMEDLQFIAMKLIIEIFIKYKQHRCEVLNDILSSLIEISEDRNRMKTYRLNTGENVQMFTALFVQLLHASLDFPTKRILNAKPEIALKQTQIFDNMLEAYTIVPQMATNFLKEVMKSCFNNSNKTGLKAVLKNFIDDLLLMFNEPEWSGTELTLEMLCKVLICYITSHNNDLSSRLLCMDFLGIILARLRKAIVTSKSKLNAVDDYIQQHCSQENYAQTEVENMVRDLNSEARRMIYSQDIILNYLNMKSQNDTTVIYASSFIISHWYHETFLQKTTSNIPGCSKGLKNLSKTEHTSLLEEKNTAYKKCTKTKETPKLSKFQKIQEWVFLRRIKCLLELPESDHMKPDPYIDYNSITLLSEYIASNGSFLQSFERYMQQVLLALTESSIPMRSRAVKTLIKIIEADPSILSRCDMQKAMQHSFSDRAIPVREAAIDLIGRFILLQPEFIEQYYNLLLSRILDAGISVRKRVISIFRNICVEHPQHPRVPEICLQMIQRVHDEEGVKKLVVQALQKMWFTPVAEEPYLDSAFLLNKVTSILKVMNLSLDTSLESLDELLAILFRSFPEPLQENATSGVSSTIIVASQQIVDCLAQKILKLEAISDLHTLTLSSSENYVLCFITLQRFAVVHPKLLVKYALTLGPYLSIKCQTLGDYQIITSVAYIMEVTLPLIQHPSEILLAEVEEYTMKAILQHDQRVVASCVSCLASVVKKVTRNYELIRDTFFTFYTFLQTFKCDYEKDPSVALLEKNHPLLQRALFTTGLFLRYFNFEDKHNFQNIDENLMDQVYQMLLYFAEQLDDSLQFCALKAVGLMCIQHPDYMLQKSLITLYHQCLTNTDSPISMKMQVLRNINMYLQEEAKSTLAQDKEWHKIGIEENLKCICDESSGMASTVMQIYIKEILSCYIHDNVELRQAVSRVTQIVLQQGLLQPMQIVPFLIAMSTDTEQSISIAADQQLKEIVIKYPGFVDTNLLSGLWLSYNIQSILQQRTGSVRGYRIHQNLPKALHSMTYSVLCKTKQQRRAFVFTLLKQFDDQANTSLSQMRYLVDNLAYFPYKLQDEPLFIIHHIDVIVATCGNNVLQSFQEALLLNQSVNQDEASTITDSESEDKMLQLIPKDTSALYKCTTAFKGCLLLLQLKYHLMEQYGISNIKIAHYSVSDPAKVYEKPLNQYKAMQLFEPQVTNEEASSDDEKNRLLVREYLQFKATMLKIEAEDSDDELHEELSVKSKNK